MEILKLISENSLDIIIIINKNQEIIFANSKIKELYGIDIQLNITTLKDIVLQDTIQIFNNKTIEIQKNKHNSFKIEHIQKRTDETKFWAEIIVNKIIDNEQADFLITIKDITEHKLLEMSFRESEHFNKSIIDATPNCIKILDLDGNLQFINYGGVKILNIKNIFDIIGKSYVKFWNPEYHDIINKLIGEAKNNIKGEFVGKFNINNQNKWFNVSFAPLKNIDHIITDILVISTDITEIKESEEKLQALNKTKDKFFSIISHDLKNPFSAIMGFSELILKNIKTINPDKLEKYVRAIYQSSVSVHVLLENLLEWAIAQNENIKLTLKYININNIVLQIITLLQLQALAKNITIEYQENPELTGVADENMLRTILRNLISNAIKYSFESGKIIISAQRQIINQPEIVKFTVTDFGTGMSPEKAEQLFKFGSDTSTPGTNAEKGTGLGLILCKEFVTRHNGEIWVESQINKGSTFNFTIRC